MDVDTGAASAAASCVAVMGAAWAAELSGVGQGLRGADGVLAALVEAGPNTKVIVPFPA